MKAKKLLYIFTTAPYSHASGQEGLDAVLIGAAFEQQVSVLFLHDGVFQIKQGQQSKESYLKQYTKTFASLADHGIENTYAHTASLMSRGLSTDDLTIDVEALDNSQVSQLIAQQFRVMSF